MSDYHHIVNVEGVVMKDNRLLMVIRSEAEDHAAGVLSFIGGKVEFTNDEPRVIESTLKREIMEEVGVEVDNLRYVTNAGFIAGRDSVVNLVFLCDWKAGEAQALDPDEVASVHWLTTEEIRTHEKLPPWLMSYVEQIETFLGQDVHK